MNIHIPASIEEVINTLSGIEGLLTAKQWERAAIVYAWTENNGRGRPSADNPPTRRYTVVAFGRLGIRGLSEPQVHAYRKAWESAAAKVGNDDMLKIEPGDGIESPDLSWKDHFGEPTTEVQERVAASVMKDPVRAAKVLTESAEVRESMAEAIVSVDEARKATVKKAAAHDVGEVERAAQSQRWGAPVTGGSRGPKVWDDMEFARLVAKLEDYLDALDKGDWVPGGAARGLIASLPLHLDRVKFPRNEKTTAEAVQQFLNEAREESTP